MHKHKIGDKLYLVQELMDDYSDWLNCCVRPFIVAKTYKLNEELYYQSTRFGSQKESNLCTAQELASVVDRVNKEIAVKNTAWV